MNNRFDIFVKKSQNKVILRLSCVVLSIALLTILTIVLKIDTIIFVPILVVLFTIVVIITTNKEKKKVIKYGLRMDVDSNIYIPLLYEKEYLLKITHELNDKLELSEDISSLVNYVQYMINNNEIVFLEKKFKLEEIVNILNNLLKAKNINYRLNANEIIQKDTDIIKQRRKDNINNDLKDLSSIRFILESNGLELIRFYAPNDGFSKLARIDGYVLTVIQINKIENLKKIQFQ